MKKRVKIYFITLSCASLILSTILCLFFVRKQAIITAQQSLDNYLASTLALADIPENPQLFVETLSKSYSGNLRITLVKKDGVVAADSHAARNDMANHLDREEITLAVQSGYGFSLRPSDTTGVDTLYVAQLWQDEYILRFSIPLSATRDFANQMLPILLVALLVLCILVTIMVDQFAKRLAKPYEQMLVHIEKTIQNSGHTADNFTFDAAYEEMQPIVQYFHYLLDQISKHISQITQKTSEIENIVGNMQEGLVLLDQDMNILMLNPQASRFLSVPPDSWQKQITYLYRIDPFIDVVNTAKKSGTHQMIDIDNENAVYRFYINPVPEGGFVMLISDVTDIVRLEHMRSDFVANVSHELKTPLTSISGFAELIETGMVSDPYTIQDYAGKIHLESLRLVHLIDDILHLSSIESASQDSNASSEPVNAKSVFEYILQLLEPQMREKELHAQIKGDLNLAVNRDHLQELALNLCDNAVKYNRQGGSFYITLGEDGFSVSDTGIGIPIEHQARIFERFYRVDKARSRKTGGTGLGLSICKHIVALYNGHIYVKSNAQGTTFMVQFPAQLVSH